MLNIFAPKFFSKSALAASYINYHLQILNLSGLSIVTAFSEHLIDYGPHKDTAQFS